MEPAYIGCSDANFHFEAATWTVWAAVAAVKGGTEGRVSGIVGQAPRAVRRLPAKQGNLLHVLQVDVDGTLVEPGDPIRLPVKGESIPLGIAVVPGG